MYKYAISHMKYIIKIIFILIIYYSLSCGRGSSNGSGSNYYINTISGKISSTTGSNSIFTDWIVVLINATTGICKSSNIDSTGSFSFKHINVNDTYTMVLLSQDYKLNSVLAHKHELGLVQYFNFKNYSQSPRIIYKGLVFNLSNTDMIEFDSTYITSDTNSNGVPDGMESSSRFNLTKTLNTNKNNQYTLVSSNSDDIDNDGIANSDDPDMDDDGIINWLDDDMDDDGIPDLLDTDSNADNISDSVSKNPKYYFDDKIEYIMLQLHRLYTSSSTIQYLSYMTKILENTPTSIQIQSSDDSFLGSQVEFYNTNNIVQYTSWDKNLLDDGYNYDGMANDKIYARKIKLASTSSIQSYQIFFINFGYNYENEEIFDSYPIIYPNITINDVTTSYNQTTKTFTLNGTPFGSSLPYYEWQIWIYNSSDVLVYTSAPLAAGVSTFTLPSTFNIQSGYYAKVYIQSNEILYGIGTFISELAKISLSSN